MGLVAAFEWLGKPYRLCRVDMLGEMREPAYARLNGRHETPVLVTSDGRCLSETMAIARWLEARDDERRISFDPLSARAERMWQLLGFLNTGYTAAYTPSRQCASPRRSRTAKARRAAAASAGMCRWRR